MDVLVPLKRGNKTIKGSRGWEQLRRKRKGGEEKRGKSHVWQEMVEIYKGPGN